MCGIVCYTGSGNTKQILLDGLKALEYRGYDSAGLAVIDLDNQGVAYYRTLGQIVELEKKLNGAGINGATGIAHNRWATHGEPSEKNAHPHTDQEKNIFLVHNGIIENYKFLKKKLEKEGVLFNSDTDTEILAQLIAKYFQGDLAKAVRKSLALVEGTFGLAVIHRSLRDEIVIARRGSPMVIGISDTGYFAASDARAFAQYTNKVKYLQDNEIAVLRPSEHEIMTTSAGKIERDPELIEWKLEDAELNGFPHFMLKEIFEQPETVENAIRGRIEFGEGMPKLGGIEPIWGNLKQCRHLIIAACGTSYYAGCVGRYIFEKLTGCEDVQVELASEFRYRNLNFAPNTYVLVLSQSGETADTLGAIREAGRKGAHLLGIVNAVGSSIARETEAGIYNHAGPEIGVASTKNFTSQLVILTLLALSMGRYQKLSLTEGVKSLKAIKALPGQIENVLRQANHIQAIAEKYHKCKNWLFLGRKFNFPIAMEGALKLKEVSYIHAEGYAAGEMKHGPIALINPEMPTVAIAPKDDMHEKMISNIQEIKARRGPVIAIITKEDNEVKEIADDYIEIPQTLDFLNPILSVIPCQLLAYHCGVLLRRDVDKPRNLAKSVTVE